MTSEARTILRVVTGKDAVDGAGVRLVRVVGNRDTKEFDPFLLLDAFDSTDPEDYIKGFPWHPHRGIETITYLIEGDIEHGDSLGNKGSILDGECQWMTAGSGIIHQEMPMACGRMLGVQLWLNMPAQKKMAAPQYHGIVRTDIPVIDEGNRSIHILAGKYKGFSGAMEGEYVKALFLDVEVDPGGIWTLPTEREETLFVYILQGEGTFDPSGKIFSAKRALLFNKGNQLQVKGAGKGLRFLVMSAKPLLEPVAWGGPIVMNTKEELELAFREIDEGTFIKS